MQKSVFLKFYVINTSDNIPFQPYYSNPHTISFQKMYILSVVQFMLKKLLPPVCVTDHANNTFCSIKKFVGSHFPSFPLPIIRTLLNF